MLAMLLPFAASRAAADGAGAVPSPVLTNASFDADASGVATPTGWVSRGSTDADFTEWGGHGGDYRLTHWSADDFVVDTEQVVTGLTPGWYALRGVARRSSGRNESYLELRCGRETRRVHVPVAWWNQWLELVVSVPVTSRSCTIALHTEAAGGEYTSFDDLTLVRGRAALPVRGADVSSLSKSEDLGGVYRDACGRPGDALDLLKAHGASYVRLRTWLHPADGYHDRDDVVRMARRAKRAGLKVLLDLHYSDTWADPGHQTKPAAWAGYDSEALREAVYTYTYETCRAMKRHGVAPAMVQIGNEINAGMLWPDGHSWGPPNWDNLARFLQAGHDAIKDCSPDTKVALHLANGGDQGAFRWWFDNVTARSVDFDVIAVSYYGYSNWPLDGSLGDLQANLNDLAARYGKEVLVAETAYPFTLGFQDDAPNVIGLPEQLVPGYPATPAGQAARFRDVLSIVQAVPNGRGLGALYWDATWTAVPGNGWDPADPTSGNSWENQAMFDFEERALPVMHELRR